MSESDSTAKIDPPPPMKCDKCGKTGATVRQSFRMTFIRKGFRPRPARACESCIVVLAKQGKTF